MHKLLHGILEVFIVPHEEVLRFLELSFSSNQIHHRSIIRHHDHIVKSLNNRNPFQDQRIDLQPLIKVGGIEDTSSATIQLIREHVVVLLS